MCSSKSGACIDRPGFNTERAPDDDFENHKIPANCPGLVHNPPPADSQCTFPDYGTRRNTCTTVLPEQ